MRLFLSLGLEDADRANPLEAHVEIMNDVQGMTGALGAAPMGISSTGAA